jgi:hypothetical protein
LASTQGEAPLSKSGKSVAFRTDLPKPKLHASLSPLIKIWLWWQHYYCFKSSVKENWLCSIGYGGGQL